MWTDPTWKAVLWICNEQRWLLRNLHLGPPKWRCQSELFCHRNHSVVYLAPPGQLGFLEMFYGQLALWEHPNS